MAHLLSRFTPHNPKRPNATPMSLDRLMPTYLAQFKNLELIAKKLVEGFISGLHRSPHQGFSVEFSEFRPYQPGEILRNIDWRLFARREKLYTRRYREETNLRAYLLVDVSDSMRYPPQSSVTKLEYALYLAAGLAYLLLSQRDAVGLYTFDHQIRDFLPAKARSTWLRPILLTLEKWRTAPPTFMRRTELSPILHTLAEKFHRRSLILLFSDLWSEESPQKLLRALAHLTYRKHEVLLFHIWDAATERDLLIPNRPLHLKDLETAQKIAIHPSELRSAYQTIVSEYFHALQSQAQSLTIEWIEADIQKSFFPLLQTYLLKRQKLG
ncbi:MAG: DUF58 domain-containing protein [Bacteroidia bacterium]